MQITTLIEEALDLDDADLSLRVVMVIEHVMHSAVLSWIHGRLTMAQVTDVIEMTAHLLLDPR